MTPCVIRQHRTDFARGAALPPSLCSGCRRSKGAQQVLLFPVSPQITAPRKKIKEEIWAPALALAGFKNRWVGGSWMLKEGSVTQDGVGKGVRM